MDNSFNNLKNNKDAFIIVDAYGHVFDLNSDECILLEEDYDNMKTVLEAKKGLFNYDLDSLPKNVKEVKSINTLSLKKSIVVD